MKLPFPGSIVGRTLLLVATAAALAVVATTLPLAPATGEAGATRLVPLDTWAAAHFPGARDFYRARLAVALTPARLLLVALSFGLLLAAALSFPHRLGDWLARRVPPLSAHGLGLFRLVFGLALLAAWQTIVPPESIPWELHRSSAWLARLPWVRLLAATPDAPYWVWMGASVALLCFAAGVWSRVALFAAATLMTLLVGVLLTMKAMHDWGVPLVTLWALLLVSWRDSVGVQTAVARWRGHAVRPVAPLQRGLALWLPGLTIGMAFAAAAFAKLDTSGAEWVTGGAVRFHFIEDARQAPVPWGLVVARSDAAAVGLSLAAVVIEGCFWLVVLVRNLWVRALFGLAGVGMLAGFHLFQGVFWPGWWALFLAFAPWPLVGAPSRAGTGSPGRMRIPALQAAVVVLLAAQQPIVSALRFESEPFVSDYSMYSYTWPSKEAFDRHLRSKTARVEMTGDAIAPGEFEARLRRVPRALEVFVEAVESAVAGEAWPETTQHAVAAARRGYEAQYGERLSHLRVQVVERGFDWERGAFEAPHIVSSGVVSLDSGRFEPMELAGRAAAP